jgi:hypothetical protein
MNIKKIILGFIIFSFGFSTFVFTASNTIDTGFILPPNGAKVTIPRLNFDNGQ